MKRGRSLALVKKGQKNAKHKLITCKKTNHFNKVLFLIGISCLIGSSTTEISASSEPTIEAVAVVEVVSGSKIPITSAYPLQMPHLRCSN